MMVFFNCRCFYTRNIFLSKYGLHVNYYSKDTFKKSYNATLRQKGCTSDEDLEAVCKQIEDEINRRRDLNYAALERRKSISESYRPLHSDIYCLQESYFDPGFLELVQLCKTAGLSGDENKKIEIHPSFRLYAFPVFTQEFCDRFTEELEYFENSDQPKGRPNTMNQYGCLLDELGFDKEFLEPLRINYLSWITRCLFPDFGGASLDSQRIFSVKYSLGQDKDLSYHYDNAEVTLNVCLGKEFTGGELYFGGLNTQPLDTTTCITYANNKTYGLLHSGRQMHGALPIHSGTRHNLIIWMRSSAVRNQLCPMCNDVPQLEKDTTGGYGQGFTEPDDDDERTVDVCYGLECRMID